MMRPSGRLTRFMTNTDYQVSITDTKKKNSLCFERLFPQCRSKIALVQSDGVSEACGRSLRRYCRSI
jgi:hypothetical protein